LGATGEELAELIRRLKARCAASGRPISRVILTHEAGRDGFWLARFLVRRGSRDAILELPVDRRARRAKKDVIDVEMQLRTLMAWLRGEPLVCSMVPIPDEVDEEARRDVGPCGAIVANKWLCCGNQMVPSSTPTPQLGLDLLHLACRFLLRR
jgi:transposase